MPPRSWQVFRAEVSRRLREIFRDDDHGQRLQGWSAAVLICLQAVHGCRTRLIASFLFCCPCGLWASLRHHDFFGSSSSCNVLSSQTQFPPGRQVRNFAAFYSYFTIGKSVSSSSSAQGAWCVYTVCGVLREDAITNCVLMLERWVSKLFHALAGCGRRCATLILGGNGAFPVDTEMDSQAH